jgi:hypothetical protein
MLNANAASPIGPRRPDRHTIRRLVAVYLILGIGASLLAFWIVPPLLIQAYHGRGPRLLTWLLAGRSARHSVEHYENLWYSFATAALFAGLFHLVVVATAQPMRRWRTAFALFALAFLGLTVVSGARHDYVADLEIWRRVLRGEDPWWILPDRRAPLNAYGPLFNVLAVLTLTNPLIPKLLFATAYLLFLTWIAKANRARGANRGITTWGILALMANPLPWVEIAYFGHFDVLVGVACVAAVVGQGRGRDRWSGVSLALGVLLKYIPIVALPFLTVEGKRLRLRLAGAAILTILLGMTLSVLTWGSSTFRPLTFAAKRGSNLLSIFRFLKGHYSPLRLIWESPNLDRLATPCLAVAGLAVFAWCWKRRVGPATAAVLAVLSTLIFYQVGFPQYHVILLMLGATWAVREGPDLRAEPKLRLTIGMYLAFFGTFEVFMAAIGGVVHPEDPWGWVDEVVGLPAFLVQAPLLTALIRWAGRKPAGALE